MIINTNMAAINANRNLGINQLGQSKSMEKLSSGMRINRAADDAAGLAISEKMRNQIRGLEQASRNAQDGISLIQTAEGALSESHEMLQRMRELSIQSLNDTYSAEDREKIQIEVTELLEEIDGIADKTEFNGMQVLAGDLGVFDPELNDPKTADNYFEGIAYAEEQIEIATVAGGDTYADLEIGIAGLDYQAYRNPEYTEEQWNNLTTSQKIAAATANNDTEVDIIDDDGNLVSYDVEALYEELSDDVKLSLDVWEEKYIEWTSDVTDPSLTDGAQLTAALEYYENLQAEGFEMDEDAIAAMFGDPEFDVTLYDPSFMDDANYDATVEDPDFDYDALETAYNALDPDFDPTDTVTNSADDIDAYNEIVNQYQSYWAYNDQQALDGYYESNQAQYDTYMEDISDKIVEYTEALDELNYDPDAPVYEGSTVYSFHTGANQDQKITVEISAMGVAALELTGLSVATTEKASAALIAIDAAINAISEQRARLGAVQNRLEYTISNVDNTAENLQSAESNIRDTDMAEEMVTLTKYNILTQATQAMLAQANQAPQQVLQLLQ